MTVPFLIMSDVLSTGVTVLPQYIELVASAIGDRRLLGLLLGSPTNIEQHSWYLIHPAALGRYDPSLDPDNVKLYEQDIFPWVIYHVSLYRMNAPSALFWIETVSTCLFSGFIDNVVLTWVCNR